MGIFFSDPNPKVTKDEYNKKIKPELRHEHFSEADMRDVDKILAGNWEESEGHRYSGINKKEMERTIKYLEEHRSKHSLSDDQIKTLKEAMEKKM